PRSPPPCPYTPLFRSEGVASYPRQAVAGTQLFVRPAGIETGRRSAIIAIPCIQPAIRQLGLEVSDERAVPRQLEATAAGSTRVLDRKSTRLNSSHVKS